MSRSRVDAHPAISALLEPEPGPRSLVEVRWGGGRLGALRGQPGRRIGESWEFSSLPGRESRACGQPLSALLGRPLPFLAKLIDTGLPLSIQVHPPPDRARGWEGKDEAWVILDAEPGAVVWVGLAPGIGAADLAERSRAALEGARPDDLLAALRRVPVQRGSIVLVPSGAVHSVGAGILLAEIQQPADLTLRLYDWGSGRELQVDAALASIDGQARVEVWQPHEAPRPLRGGCLDLDVLGSGSHRVDRPGDLLVIPVSGRCELAARDAHARLGPGELRLCTAGPLRVEVSSGGLAVLGRIHPRDAASPPDTPGS